MNASHSNLPSFFPIRSARWYNASFTLASVFVSGSSPAFVNWPTRLVRSFPFRRSLKGLTDRCDVAGSYSRLSLASSLKGQTLIIEVVRAIATSYEDTLLPPSFVHPANACMATGLCHARTVQVMQALLVRLRSFYLQNFRFDISA